MQSVVLEVGHDADAARGIAAGLRHISVARESDVDDVGVVTQVVARELSQVHERAHARERSAGGPGPPHVDGEVRRAVPAVPQRRESAEVPAEPDVVGIPPGVEQLAPRHDAAAAADELLERVPQSHGAIVPLARGPRSRRSALVESRSPD